MFGVCTVAGGRPNTCPAGSTDRVESVRAFANEQEVDALSRLPGLHAVPTVVESGKSGTDAS